MKKVISYILSVLIVVSCTCSFTTFANASESASFSIGSAENQAGGTVEIPIEINNNPGITSFRLVIQYDSAIFKLTNVSFKDAAQGFSTSTSQIYDSPYSISGYNSEIDLNKNGQLAVLTFEISPYAAEGRYDISLSYDEEDVFNMAGGNVLFDLNNGWVDISPCKHVGGQWEYLEEETCTSDGVMVKRCDICSNEYERKGIAAKGHSFSAWIHEKDPTCTENGEKSRKCSACDYEEFEILQASGHQYLNHTVKATKNQNGSVITQCTVCGNVECEKVIYYPKTITLSAASYTYDGKVKKPTVTVKDSKGNMIKASNYTVTYQSGRKNVGKYNVTIQFKGNYSGTVTKTFTIKPKTTSISQLTAGKKKFNAKWKKQKSQTTGYQIQYSTSSKFAAKTTKAATVSNNKTTAKTVSKLKANKKYYVRIRTYKTVKVNGKNTKIYSSWSKAKTVKTK